MSNVPKLRFSEFSGEWEENNLKKLSELITKGTTPKKFSNSGITFVKIEGINNLSINKDKCLFIDENTHNKELKRSILKEQDILFAIAGSLGKVAVVTKNILPANTNQALSIIRLKNKDYLNYILFVLQSRRMKKYIYKNLSVGAQPNLSLEQIGNFNFFLPLKQEQEKIASFLISVDTKIEQLTKKEKLLQQYKKGVMQKIFNQEIRFSPKGTSSQAQGDADDGSKFCDWEEKKLGELCKIAKSGGTPTSTNKSFYNGDIPFLAISDMTKQGKYLTYASKRVAQKGLDNSSSWIVPENTIIYSMYASVGFVSINKIPLATSQAVINLILKDDVNIEYVYYYLLDYKKYIHKYIETGTQGNLNAQSVKSLKINLPCLEEQEKIANFLSSIDKKIEVTKIELEKTKEFKKALLQQMFV